MRLVDQRTGLEVLSEDECLALLQQDVVGRLAVSDGGQPVVFPVNYVLDGRSVVFRTDQGTKRESGPRAPVCFEIDYFDREHRGGWSVVVLGWLEEVDDADGALAHRVRSLPVDPWAGGAKPYWMRVVPRRISGRRVSATSGPDGREP